MIVMKFGGTSVKDSIAMDRVVNIVSSFAERQPVVVLSACSGMTDKLLRLVSLAAVEFDSECRNIFDGIVGHHETLIESLIKQPDIKANAKESTGRLFADLNNLVEGISLLKECTQRSLDSVAAFGELLSTTIFEAACRDRGFDAAFVDARKVMATDSSFGKAAVNKPLVKKNASDIILPLINDNKIVITQGFIGSDQNGHTTTLGRGGSDYSAAIFGEACGAEEIQIWTDVPGVLSADPRKVPNARTIPLMSFAEIRELSFYGAKVLHPETIKPAIESNIPVRVLDSARPDHPGTLIIDNINDNEPDLRSVLLKENCLLCRVEIPFNENSQLYFAKLLRALSKTGAKILSSISTENSCQIIVEKTADIDEEALASVMEIYHVNPEETSLICLCGVNLLYPNERVNNIMVMVTRLLTQSKPSGVVFGASSVSIIILVPSHYGQRALNGIHTLIVEGK